MSLFIRVTSLSWACGGKGLHSWIPHYDFLSDCRYAAVGHAEDGRKVGDPLHIDDFITMGAPESNECAMNSATMHQACDKMGLPTEPEKDEGPATRMPFLGIELDSMAMEIWLPPEKLDDLRKELTAWKTRKACKK